MNTEMEIEMGAGDEKEEEVTDCGGGAEAVLNLSPGSTISVRYHSLFGAHDDIFLLEVDDKLLPDILHHRVVVRGKPDEEAVLCTPAATYAMKFVGTSNSVFLIPPAEATPRSSENGCCDGVSNVSAVSSVIKVASGTMELNLVAPRIDKLKTLVSKRPYRLEEDLEANSQGKSGLYSWLDLVEQIQASEQELRDGLRTLSAVEIDGCWRTVDCKTMDEILNMILNNSILHRWPLSALKEEEVISVLEADGYPARIVLHCLDTFGSKEESSGCSLWSLDEKQVCLRFAIRALGGGKMKLENFMDKWILSVPSGMQADLKMLEGEVLYEKLGIETWIRAFSVSALPSTPAERFAALFQERAKWEWKDLEPFIRDLRVPGLSSEGLLLKYTRRTQPNSDVEPIFSAR